MNITKPLLVALALALPIAVSAEAAKDAVKKEVAKKEPAKKEVNKEAVEAAGKLFASMNLKDVYKKIVDASTASLVQREPKLESVKDKISAFYNKHIGWDAVKDDMAKIYAKYYTAADLEELAKFYNTDLGKKTLAMLPKISQEGRALGMKKVMSHQDELQKIVQKALAPKEEKKAEAKKESKK
ncbi:MAG TPA: DUF2059 domain-containing protein [Nitratifractor sp.]|nr:DUF2059 domain-containing protein [Nitratifractor sp.]HHH20990.1 DUF2059 domain-containing protein [Nitratifractor sp.]